MTKKNGKPRGFAAMNKEQQRKIASMGGKASHGGGAQYHKARLQTRGASREA